MRGGEEPELACQVEQERDMEIGSPRVALVEPSHRAYDESIQAAVALGMTRGMVEHLAQEHAYRHLDRVHAECPPCHG